MTHPYKLCCKCRSMKHAAKTNLKESVKCSDTIFNEGGFYLANERNMNMEFLCPFLCIHKQNSVGIMDISIIMESHYMASNEWLRHKKKT